MSVARHGTAPLFAVASISAAALGYEILLTRVFAIVHWHHLVAIAISLALLGFGASGTFLALAGERLRRHYTRTFIVNALLFGIGVPACVQFAAAIPVDPQLIAWQPLEGLRLGGVFVVLAIPFFAAANCIGLTLWHHPAEVARIYAADLIGAATGALAVLGMLALLQPPLALVAISALGLAASAPLVARHWRLPVVAAIALALLVAGLTGIPRVQPAAYKDLARSLAVSGARVVYRDHALSGVLTLVRNDVVPLRHAPGLSLQSALTPPAQLAAFVDGDAVGGLADRATPVDDGYLGELLSAVAYRAVRPAHVAVLDAGTAQRVDQALQLGAGRISAVEANRSFRTLLCEHFAAWRIPACDPARVRWVDSSARAALATDARRYDLISLPVDADPAGVDALRIDHDSTVEAVRLYLDRLAHGGLLAIEGPARVPPNLSLRMLDSVARALRANGADHPDQHIVLVRGWRQFVLLAAPQPLDAAALAAIRDFCASRGFDLAWLPDMQRAEANRFQQLARPWYHDAARRLLGAADMASDDMRDTAGLEGTPVTDDRPFPARSTRWSSLPAALSGTPAERARLDTALLLGITALFTVTLGALLLIVAPLLALPRRRTDSQPGRWRVLAHFALIGLAFLSMELAWIQRMEMLFRQPVLATTLVLAAFLAFAGLGSAWAQRQARRAPLLLWVGIAVIALAGAVYLYVAPTLFSILSGQHLAVRLVAATALLAPLAFAMGLPFPLGLAAVAQQSPDLVPWAWAINGATSVVAAAAAPLLAATIGFHGLVGGAICAYLLLPLAGLVGSQRAA